MPVSYTHLDVYKRQVIMLATGNTAPYDLLTNMGSGASGMFETCMVAAVSYTHLRIDVSIGCY